MKNYGYCSKCYGLDDDMSDCDNCLGTGEEPFMCKYSNKNIAEKWCNGCGAGLCGSKGGSCGYIVSGRNYCNECYEELRSEAGDGQYIEEPSY